MLRIHGKIKEEAANCIAYTLGRKIVLAVKCDENMGKLACWITERLSA